MKTSHTYLASIMAAGFLTLANPANAANISTLFNTGVDASGSVLPSGTINDSHYSLTVVPTGSTTDTRIIAAIDGYPIDGSHYLGDNTLSRWIGPNNASDLTSPSGTYVYHTTFDLTGFNVSTAHIVGQWATDNQGLDIALNNNSLGLTNNVEYSSFTGFSISNGFVAGLNTLDFTVFNGSAPTALRVEMTGTASLISAVPVPAATWLFGSGVVALFGSVFRRKVA